MNPIALINTKSGGLDGAIAFPPSAPANQYLSGNGDWITITAGSGSRTRTVIQITNQASITGGTVTNGSILQHTAGTDSVVYVRPTETIKLCLPSVANEGDRITIMVLNESYGVRLYQCHNSTSTNRTIYDTSLKHGSQKAYNTYYTVSGSTVKGPLEFYFTQFDGYSQMMWGGPITTIVS